MLVIGLTGSFATGKSTVAGMFRKLGARVISADTIAQQQLKRTSKVFKKIVQNFGRGILTRGTVDRKKLAGIVFGNAKKRKELEQLIHPQVRLEVQRKLRQYKQGKRTRVVIVEVPLLFESGMHRMMDMTIVVKTQQQTQIARAMKKYKMMKGQVLKRIKVQMSLSKKIRLADYVIDNNHNLTLTKKQVSKKWDELLLKTKKKVGTKNQMVKI